MYLFPLADHNLNTLVDYKLKIVSLSTSTSMMSSIMNTKSQTKHSFNSEIMQIEVEIMQIEVTGLRLLG